MLVSSLCLVCCRRPILHPDFREACSVVFVTPQNMYPLFYRCIFHSVSLWLKLFWWHNYTVWPLQKPGAPPGGWGQTHWWLIVIFRQQNVTVALIWNQFLSIFSLYLKSALLRVRWADIGWYTIHFHTRETAFSHIKCLYACSHVTKANVTLQDPPGGAGKWKPWNCVCVRSFPRSWCLFPLGLTTPAGPVTPGPWQLSSSSPWPTSWIWWDFR